MAQTSAWFRVATTGQNSRTLGEADFRGGGGAAAVGPRARMVRLETRKQLHAAVSQPGREVLMGQQLNDDLRACIQQTVTRRGYTALHCAVFNRNNECVAYLLESGAIMKRSETKLSKII